jgi:large conductance mechanosensitive channel
MTGFKNFVLRGNLVEIAVAFIMGVAFASVVTEFTTMITSFLSRIGGQPDFGAVTIADVKVGLFINALISFLLTAAVVYFLVVVPYTKAKERYFPQEPEGMPADVALLTEIRDLLRTTSAG